MSKKSLFNLLNQTRDNKPTSSAVKDMPVEEDAFKMEELSLEDVYYSKTFTFRLDTLLMGGVLGLVLIAITFFLGRMSVSTPETVKYASPKFAPKKDMDMAANQGQKKNHSNSADAGDKTDGGNGEETGPKAPTGGKFHLILLTSPTQEGAQEVVTFLSEKGLMGFVKTRSSRRHEVRIGGFGKRDSNVLKKVRTMVYKGRPWFSTAYYVPNRSRKRG